MNAVSKELNKSWNAVPFVEVLAVDSEIYPEGCPETHEELIYDIWPGTTMMCDCLERNDYGTDRDYFLDIECVTGKNAPHNSADCFNIAGQPPRVLSSINGVRYCAKRAESYLSMYERVLPVEADNGSYKCPENTKACNESWLSDKEHAQSVICIPEYDDIEDDCPITSFKFELDGQSDSANYKMAENFGNT